MTLIDVVLVWARSLDGLMAAMGAEVRAGQSDTDRANPSCFVNLRRGEAEADLVLWESGECEVAVVSAHGRLEQEHFAELGIASLGEVLNRMLTAIS